MVDAFFKNWNSIYLGAQKHSCYLTCQSIPSQEVVQHKNMGNSVAMGVTELRKSWLLERCPIIKTKSSFTGNDLALGIMKKSSF